MVNVIKVGSMVMSAEHPRAVGEVMREIDGGFAIEFRTPARPDLPYGHIITEFWPAADLSSLVVIK